jgi:hypothetical protein
VFKTLITAFASLCAVTANSEVRQRYKGMEQSCIPSAGAPSKQDRLGLLWFVEPSIWRLSAGLNVAIGDGSNVARTRRIIDTTANLIAQLRELDRQRELVRKANPSARRLRDQTKRNFTVIEGGRPSCQPVQ